MFAGICIDALSCVQYATLFDAMTSGHAITADPLLRVVATTCLCEGHKISKTHVQLFPVSICQIGVVVKACLPELTGKILANLESEQCRPYIKVIPGPKGTQPAILPVLSALIRKQDKTAEVKAALAALQISHEHPQSTTALGGSDGSIHISSSAFTSHSRELEVCVLSLA